jgi:hypothetical protein
VLLSLYLLQVSDFPLGFIFSLCSIFLAAAAGCQHRLGSITSSMPTTRMRKDHVSDGFGQADKQLLLQQQEQQQHLLQMPEMSQRQSQERQQQQQVQQPSVQFVSISRSGVLSRRQEQDERKGSSSRLDHRKGSSCQLDQMH